MSETAKISAPRVQTSSARTGHRFPRTNKLLKHALFDQVYQCGQRHFSGLMTVFFLRREPEPEKVSNFEFQVSSGGGDLVRTVPLKPSAGLNGAPALAPGGPRIGLTVGRVLGNSVVRNRIRRRMREAVRLNLHRLTGPVDVVINPKKAVLTAEFNRIAEEVRKAFEAVARKIESADRIESDSCTDRTSTRPDGAPPRRHIRGRRRPQSKDRRA